MRRDDIEALVQRGQRAEESIGRVLAGKDDAPPVRMSALQYTSTRDITPEMLARAGGSLRMFAISAKTDAGMRDVIYARTPELAKFVHDLIAQGDGLVSALLALEDEG